MKGVLAIEQDGDTYFLRRGPKPDFDSLDAEERVVAHPLVGLHETLAVNQANHVAIGGAVTALKDLLRNRYYRKTFVRNTGFFVFGVLLTILSLVLGVMLAAIIGVVLADLLARDGSRYADLDNAFAYRQRVVAGCTCNGKDPGGLARVDVDSDPTIRKGDLVASPHGLVVANTGGSGRHGAVNYSPASKSVRARFERLPVVAAE